MDITSTPEIVDDNGHRHMHRIGLDDNILPADFTDLLKPETLAQAFTRLRRGGYIDVCRRDLVNEDLVAECAFVAYDRWQCGHELTIGETITCYYVARMEQIDAEYGEAIDKLLADESIPRGDPFRAACRPVDRRRANARYRLRTEVGLAGRSGL